MPISMTINGDDRDDIFLIAPAGDRTFPVPLSLVCVPTIVFVGGVATADCSSCGSADCAPVTATLQLVPGGANVDFEATSVQVGLTETTVQIHATSASNSRGDTVLQVLVDGNVMLTRRLTVIANPRVCFHGRFEARFATAPDPYNHPRGNSNPYKRFRDEGDPDIDTTSLATIDATRRWGWTWALEDEPDFVPADSVVDSIDKPVGRVIRFHNPIALRPHVPPIGVKVVAIRGTLATGVEEEFTRGDPVIGQPVNLGPNSYFAGNNRKRPSEPNPAEGPYPDAREPIANFEFHIGCSFFGKCKTPDDRPITDPTDPRPLRELTPEERAKFDILPLAEFNRRRIDALLCDYRALPENERPQIPDPTTTDTFTGGTMAGRNLATRIAFLGGAQLGGAPEQDIRPSRRRTLAPGYDGKEVFTGTINDAISITPGRSAALAFLAGFEAFTFAADFFNFHSDELCGQVNGCIFPAVDELPAIAGRMDAAAHAPGVDRLPSDSDEDSAGFAVLADSPRMAAAARAPGAKRIPEEPDDDDNEEVAVPPDSPRMAAAAHAPGVNRIPEEPDDDDNPGSE